MQRWAEDGKGRTAVDREETVWQRGGQSVAAHLIMADIKFSCPHCEQHIQAEAGYAGIQINCPHCQGSMVVPGVAVAPVPTPPSPRPNIPPPSPPAGVAGTSGCPSCGAALPRGAVLCTHCGYNLATRQRTVAGRPAPLGKPKAPSGEEPWYKTPYPYLGVVVVALMLLFFLGRTNPSLKIVYVLVAAVYILVTHILVVISAFRESVGTGFLTLCIPFYGIYYVFFVNDSQTLKIMYGLAIMCNVSIKFAAGD